MFKRTVDTYLYFAGALFISVSVGSMVEPVQYGFITFGVFCLIAAVLK